jgi:hypothetical protein
MERRRSTRKKVKQRIVLESLRSGGALTAMRELSLGGTFVDACSVPLPRNALVAVSFHLGHSHFDLEAMVVRRTETGAALMFLRMAPDTIRALSDALREPTTSNVHRTTRENIANIAAQRRG